jgi:hypothetical protein
MSGLRRFATLNWLLRSSASGRAVAFVSEVRVPVLSVVCEPCGRRERYDVERLTRQNGRTAKLTDLLPALMADCPKRGSASVYDRCKAVFETRLGKACDMPHNAPHVHPEALIRHARASD